MAARITMVIATVIAMLMPVFGPDRPAHAGAGGDLEWDRLTTWVATRPEGGVPRPSAPCQPWAFLADDPEDPVWDGLINARVEPDGIVARLHFRDCGTTRQIVWIRQESPESLARTAVSDLQSRMLPLPEPVFSPPERSVVHLETWMAVTDPGEVSVRAAIPGLSVTVSAQVVATVFTLDDGAGEVHRLECPGLGAHWSAGAADQPAGCGHTFRRVHPGVVVQAASVWVGQWASSSGDGGEVGPVTGPATTVTMPVVEIVTTGRG